MNRNRLSQTNRPSRDATSEPGRAPATGRRWHILGQALSSWPLRILGTAVCLWIIASSINVQHLISLVTRTDSGLLFAAWAATVAVKLCAIAEWGVLVRHVKKVRWSTLTYVFLKMLAPALVLPAGIGGEAYRIYRTAGLIGVYHATAVAAGSRLCSTVALALLAFIGSLFLDTTFREVAIISSSIFLLALLLLTAFAFWSNGSARSNQVAADHPEKGNSHFKQVLSVLHEVGHNKKGIVLSLISSLIGWSFNLLSIHLFALAIGVNVPWYLFAVAFPLTLTATFVPFVIAGIGIREGILIGLLTNAGIGIDESTLIAIFIDLQFVPYVLISILLWLLPSSPEQKVP